MTLPVLDPRDRRLRPAKAALGHLVRDVELGQSALPPGVAEQLGGEALGLRVLLVHDDRPDVFDAAIDAFGRARALTTLRSRSHRGCTGSMFVTAEAGDMTDSRQAMKINMPRCHLADPVPPAHTARLSEWGRAELGGKRGHRRDVALRL